METLFIPQPDTIPAHWGWFQFLLLLTFPLHLLAMNAMIGGLVIAIAQHLGGGPVRRQLAHRIALALPLVIAFVVNFGVAPLLFVQVLYGQFVYTSSILMGSYWILVIPILILAYYGAYLYDFKFKALGAFGPWIALVVLVLMLAIGFFFSNNMLLMALPERFADYFAAQNGTILSFRHQEFWPRFLHMMFGALAMGGLFVVLLGKIKGYENKDLRIHSEKVGLLVFNLFTLINIGIGFWYLLSLPGPQRQLFLGANTMATLLFILAMLLVCVVIYFGVTRRFWATLATAVLLVVVMTFMRAWLRSSYLQDHFTLDQLQLVPQYSPLVFFLVTLVLGLACIAWMIRQTMLAMD